MVKVGEIECTVGLHSDEHPSIFLAECPEIIYMPLNSTVEIELITPNGEMYALLDADEALADFAIDAILGEFVAMEELNISGCKIPYKDNAGESIICGFSFDNDDGEKIIIEGLTLRLGNKFSNQDSPSPKNAPALEEGPGEEGPPGGQH